MQAHSTATREKLNLTTNEFESFQEFLSNLKPYINSLKSRLTIPSPPPQISSKSKRATGQGPVFEPYDWVGSYPYDVVVTPGKLSDNEYDQMINDIAEWATVWSIPSVSAALPVYNSEAAEPESLILPYSKILIEITEEALRHRPPVTVERRRKQGTDPRGPIQFEATIQQQARGAQQVVYDKTQFSFDTLPNRLLVRFHAVLAEDLSALLNYAPTQTEHVRKHRAFHTEFIQTRLPTDLVTQSLETDFADPAVLEQTRRAAPTRLVEIVDMWEAYQSGRALRGHLKGQLNTGIKPMSRLYELWVLGHLLDILEDLTGERYTRVSDGLDRFAVGDTISVYYDTALREQSRYLANSLNFHPGRPDFAIGVADEIVWIGDAKYRDKSGIGLEDYQRLMSYAVDLMIPSNNATAATVYLGASTVDVKTKTVADDEGYSFIETPFRPSTTTTQREQLRNHLENVLPQISR